MKHPIRDHDHLSRRDAGDEATIIIGEEISQETVIAPQTTPEPAHRMDRMDRMDHMDKSIPPDPGHTRILRPPSTVDAGPAVATDMVVGWLVVLAGPGRGNFRPIFSGSNPIGSASGRIVINFGDDAISREKQAYLVYDGGKRQFLMVPNLDKPNLVSVNGSALLSNTELKSRDKIVMGTTTLLFVPLCGSDFDWTEATA
ncbi:MAG: FHA domain-containing protein [Hyphomicrobiaceae bacterium]